MSAEKIIGEWKKGSFKPIYWLEGEESFFIDQVIEYAEHKILTEAESGFNLTVFYGKDADWASVVNACMRYPMFAERQVVLLKEAQQMRDIEKLEGYIENPLPSTVFVVSYKEKKVDGRSKLSKLLKQKGEMLTTKKMYDSQLPAWAGDMVNRHGLSITQKALMLLVDHIGNDLSRIQNEIEKLAVNLGKRKEITEDDIENYIGVSKEFNVFELQAAIAQKNLSKAIRIIQYFEANPKAEVALAGTIVTDGDGKYMCHRHSLVPQAQHIWYRFPVLTSSVFIRRKIIHERGLYFDTKWRDLGDFHWVLSLMKNKVPMKVCDTFTSVFADTGENMNLKPNAIREKAETAAITPGWVQRLKPVWVVHHRLRRLVAGHFSLKPTSYSIYTKESPDKRVTIAVPKPTAVWWNRL